MLRGFDFMRKIAVMTLCMVLVFSLIGCGTKDTEESIDTTFPFAYEQAGDSIVLTKYTGTEESLFIPDKIAGIPVAEIGDSCFAGDVHMKKVHIPEGITTIGDYAFECCSVLEKVYLPETLTTIGDGAFSGCGSIKMIDMQNQVEEIGTGAFLFCRKLNTFYAPAALRKLGDFAFAGCQNLYVADLSRSQLSEIPDRAFYSNTKLTNIILPETVTGIGMRAFASCPKIETIYFPGNVNHISSYAFQDCSELMSFDVKGGDVEAFAFTGCYNLHFIAFSAVPITLHSDAFSGTDLVAEELWIPETVTIEDGAFPVIELPEENLEETVEEEFAEEEYTEEVAEEDYTEEAPEEGVNAAAETTPVPDWDDIKTADEILADAEAAGYKVVPTPHFDAWADEYLEYNKDTADFERDNNVYTDMYKRQIENYYGAMTAAATKNPDDIAAAALDHGDDFIPMYEMVNHGLHTEMMRFRMPEDMLFLTGVYDSQLMAAANSDKVPSMEELKALVGTTFTDPCLTSTTNDVIVAVDFSDTMFVIYAPADSLNALGAVSMDAYMRTFEKETLLFSGAEYEILDAGYFSYEKEDDMTGNTETSYEKYVLVKLINQ